MSLLRRNSLIKIITKLKRLIKYSWSRFFLRINIDSPPIFIVGCGHSGTSLLINIIGSHSRIYPISGESNIARKTTDKQFIKDIATLNQWAIADKKHRWIEKTPLHIYHIEDILRISPKAKILLMIRDGRDVSASIKKRTNNLQQGITRWLNDNLEGKKHWKKSNVHVFKYENLISDFDNVITQIMLFLDEEYEIQMKDFHKTPKQYYSENDTKPENAFGSNHEQHRNWQINQPLFDGRGKWKSLSTDELKMINDQAGKLLTELKYIEK